MNELVVIKELGAQPIIKKDGTTSMHKGKVNTATYVIARCFCGTEFKAIRAKIINGQRKSCGCMHPLIVLNNKKASTAYTDMMRRCYGYTLGYNRQQLQHYKEVTVCEEWKGQNGRLSFIEWWNSQPNADNPAVHLDKDILSRDLDNPNYIYSPETCLLVTKAENMQATRLIKSNNKTGYRGVQVRATKEGSKAKRFRAELRVNFVRYNLGSYKLIEEAAYAVNYFINNSNALQPLNAIDLSGISTMSVESNKYLRKSLDSINQTNIKTP